MTRMTLALGIVASGLLAGCVVGPNYHRPPVPAPAAYKTEGPWRVAAPKDSIPKGAWWEIFNDAELNSYEQQLLRRTSRWRQPKIVSARPARWREWHRRDTSLL